MDNQFTPTHSAALRKTQKLPEKHLVNLGSMNAMVFLENGKISNLGAIKASN
ncbi:hypothetical protein GO594_06960 [Pseudomonas otitidis]|uniref:Uncharacterized protein n=2 Tax=Metapseudomonas otitidis TaxID=319939 RepID=A0A7X3H730_9GAMM|nr:hypothetical protein [Pseudomonas otitidis]MWK55709.1 hypothetical protein [Pseudomonas otitidis]